MNLSLFLTGGENAPLLLETLREADRRGLASIWLPERRRDHGLFPNPAVVAAAAAVATRRLALRAVGLALPFHNPIRVAEEWALVDNLSGGRVGIAVDPGVETSLAQIETVRRLWRGEAARVPDGEGRPIEVRILPRPIQRELPLWSTGPRSAAALGAGLFVPEPEGAEAEIAAYRAAGGRGPVAVAARGVSAEIERLAALGVDEVAVRVDLGEARDVIEVLEALREVRHGG